MLNSSGQSNSSDTVAPPRQPRRRRWANRSALLGKSHLLKPAYRQTSLPEILGTTDALTEFLRASCKGEGNQRCPHCGVEAHHYRCKGTGRWKCREILCGRRFTVFTRTYLHGTKIEPRILLTILYQFVEAKDSISASEISRLYNLDHKTAHVLLLKVRQAVYDAMLASAPLTGDIQLDGAYFCKYRRPGNTGNGPAFSGKAAQKNAGLTETGKLPKPVSDTMHALIVFVSVGSPRRYKIAVVKTENQIAINDLTPKFVAPGSTITTDQHGAYGALFAFAEHKTTDHSKHYVNEDGDHTNIAESLFGRIRQAHAGAWHRMTVEWLAFYAAEMAWRQEMVGRGNLEQLRDLLSKLMNGRTSGRLKDYWRKSAAGKEIPAGDSDAVYFLVPSDHVPKKRGRPRKQPPTNATPSS
jgi:transposase-like protein